MRPYNVGPDAALVNFKAVRLTFVPDAQTRTGADLPRAAVAGTAHRQQPRRVRCAVRRAGRKSRRPISPPRRSCSTAIYPLACGEKSKHFSLLPPLEYTRALFDHLWRGLGGTFSGRVREGSVAAGSTPLASIESSTLLELVRDINKNSNNVMARQLYLG